MESSPDGIGPRRPHPHVVQAAGTTTHLHQLADELGSDRYATILTGGRMPTLRVVNRQVPRLAEDIHTGDGWFCGASAGPLAPCEEVTAAARAVAWVLGARVR